MKLKYFTFDNINIIYDKFREELDIYQLPHLGLPLDYGMGDICLEEDNNLFKFYIVNRSEKYNYEEFNNIEDGINKLVTYYDNYDLVDDSNKMERIMYQTLGLQKDKTLSLKKEL